MVLPSSLVAGLVAVGGCAPITLESPPAIYVVQAPLCLLGCAVDLGSIRDADGSSISQASQAGVAGGSGG